MSQLNCKVFKTKPTHLCQVVLIFQFGPVYPNILPVHSVINQGRGWVGVGGGDLCSSPEPVNRASVFALGNSSSSLFGLRGHRCELLLPLFLTASFLLLIRQAERVRLWSQSRDTPTRPTDASKAGLATQSGLLTISLTFSELRGCVTRSPSGRETSRMENMSE